MNFGFYSLSKLKIWIYFDVFFPGPVTGMLVPLLKNFPAQRTEFWWWKSFWKVSDSRLLKQNWWNSWSSVLVSTVIKLIVTLRELSGWIHSWMCVLVWFAILSVCTTTVLVLVSGHLNVKRPLAHIMVMMHVYKDIPIYVHIIFL